MPPSRRPERTDSPVHSDKDLDMARAVWDLEYRAEVKAYLNRTPAEECRRSVAY